MDIPLFDILEVRNLQFLRRAESGAETCYRLVWEIRSSRNSSMAISLDTGISTVGVGGESVVLINARLKSLFEKFFQFLGTT